MVETENDAFVAAGFGKLTENVAAEWRPGDVEVCQFAWPETKSVVVLAGDDDVLHPRVLRDHHPLHGIEVDRVELLLERHVVVGVNLHRVEDPLCATSSPTFPVPAGDRVETPVDEETETGFPPPRHPGVVLVRRLRERRCHAGWKLGWPPRVFRRGNGAGREGGMNEQAEGKWHRVVLRYRS